MEDAEIVLMFCFLAIPVAIWLQIWVKNRKQNRKNPLGEEEFENTGRAFFSIIIEGTAMIGGLIIIIVATSGIVKYIINFYT
ncbi:MAG: hypothetical protein KDF59_14440 [Nitrosomonas sp.]|nr:hypothetical protein [Nitrosomonas sp.]